MKKSSIIMTCLIFAFSSVCFSDTIHVPADQSTIQAGIDAALNGDVVLVAPGTYVENIDFIGKDITVKSSGGAESTVIDGGNPVDPDLGSVVTFSSGETLDSVLEGFTVCNGSGTHITVSPDQNCYGGGIYIVDGSSPTVKDNVIKDNSAEGINKSYGGGIYCAYNSNPLITGNEIINNFACNISTWEGFGGGIYCTDQSNPTIEYNKIIENQGVSYGGGIYCIQFSSPLISENTISYNDGIAGVGIYCGINSDPVIEKNTIQYNECIGTILSSVFFYNASPTLEQNIISNNNGIAVLGMDTSSEVLNNIITDNAYGGVSLEGESPVISGNLICSNAGGIGITCTGRAIISNNMIAGNSSAGIGCNAGAPEITNCTIVGNTSFGIKVNSSIGHPVFTNCVIWDNDIEIYVSSGGVSVDYSCIKGGWPGTDNINLDPLLVDALNFDFHLTYNSPCRDTGNNLVAIDDTDFENDPRIVYGAVDMGADEFSNHLYCTGNFTPGGAIEAKFVGLPDTWPVGLFLGSGVMDPPLQHGWGDFYLEAPWLLIPLLPLPTSGVLVIPEVIPASPVASYDIPMQALIGWELSNLFVLEVR